MICVSQVFREKVQCNPFQMENVFRVEKIESLSFL